MLGTFIPQSLEAHEYLERFPEFGHMILALGFDDMYHGLAFQLCLWFLSISTISCILNRWRSTSRTLFSRLENAGEKEIRAFELNQVLTDVKDFDLDKHFPEVSEKENGIRVGLRTFGKASLFGGMFIHIGFLLILAGGLIGVFYGVEMAVRGKVGDKVAIPGIDAIRAARDADKLSRKARNIRHFSPNAPVLEKYRSQVEKLQQIYFESLASPAFKVVFDDLWVDHHLTEDGKPLGIKSWNSAIHFTKEGKILASGVVRVNQPLTFEGYSFFQANWNKTYDRITVRVDLLRDKEGWENYVTPGATFPVTVQLSYDKEMSFDWTPLKFVLHDFMPDFRIIDGHFVSVSNELNNPAARIIAYDQNGGIAGRAWAFPDDRIMSSSHVSNLPFLFTFIGAEPVFESGLQMTYDPGKPVVWLGCLLFTVGLIMSFYITYREEWVVVYPDNRIRVAVWGNRPAEVLRACLDRLRAELLGERQSSTDQENT
ncbi:MAG: cytochrome c biogenesis protein ResB [Candidatus Rifleibacteriota bacterium]